MAVARSMATEPALAAAYADCHRLARATAKNFYYSFLLLPRPQRLAMCALYAFMRKTDDLGDDEGPSPEERRVALVDWRQTLDAVVADPDAAPAAWWLALRDTLQTYQIPTDLLHAVIDGVESDLEVTHYTTADDLYHYCYNVASAVGLACIRIWGCHDPAALEPAEHCGQAFQLTNILRDIAEDKSRQRLYLAQEDLERFGVAEEDLVSGSANLPAVLELLRFYIAKANHYYHSARRLEALLPMPGRAVWLAMMDIYGGLLHKIERDPLAVLHRRVSLSAFAKLAILAGHWPKTLFSR